MISITIDILSKDAEAKILKYLSQFGHHEIEIVNEQEEHDLILATRGQETIELNEFLSLEYGKNKGSH